MHVHIAHSGCYVKAIGLQALHVANTRYDLWSIYRQIPFPPLSNLLCRQKHHDWFVAIQVAATHLGLKRRKVLDWIHIAEEGGIVRLPQRLMNVLVP